MFLVHTIFFLNHLNLLPGPALCRLQERVVRAQCDTISNNSQDIHGRLYEQDLLLRLLPNLKAGARLSPPEKELLVQLFREEGTYSIKTFCCTKK